MTRVDLDELGADRYGSCLIEGLVATSGYDSVVPSPGAGFGYLVQAQN